MHAERQGVLAGRGQGDGERGDALPGIGRDTHEQQRQHDADRLDGRERIAGPPVQPHPQEQRDRDEDGERGDRGRPAAPPRPQC
ncbi:hypothetical protein DR093_03125, partial [Mycoplasma flocculare]|nr:hypothetical protein [Mesomycoplasma flocculare]